MAFILIYFSVDIIQSNAIFRADQKNEEKIII